MLKDMRSPDGCSFPWRSRRSGRAEQWNFGPATYRFPSGLVTVLTLTIGLTLTSSRRPAVAQNYLPQEAFAKVLTPRTDSLKVIPKVSYRYYVADRKSHLWSRINLYETIGKKNLPIVQLLNRTVLEDFNRGDTLVVPQTFDVDWRAHAPFPLRYDGAMDLEKLVVLDRTLQVFAAYQRGSLVRWGLTNTVRKGANTPSGRFNFNWKTEYRRSSINRLCPVKC